MWHKYWTVFQISWQNGLVYRLNFILWRIRSLIVILTVYFLWEAVFRNSSTVFGYDRDKILTYVFLTLVVRSLVMGQRSADAAGEIERGELSNYLLKPISFHLYWFTRDIADKLLNFIFAIGEILLLYKLLNPPFYLQTNLTILAGFVTVVLLGIVLNFVLGNIASNFVFWTPGNAWGFWFVYLVFQDLMGGVMFPLDIFPKVIYRVVMLTPFPYLLFFQANLYLGKIVGWEFFQGFLIMLTWLLLGTFVLRKEWAKGLKVYQAQGR